MNKCPVYLWPGLLDPKTASAYLSIRIRTIEDCIQIGLLDPVPIPGSTIKDKSGGVIVSAKSRRIANILIDRQDLDRLIEERRAAL